MKSRWFSIVCFSLLFFSQPAFGAPGENRIKAAVLRHFPPQYSLSTDGQPQGFAIDVLDAVASIANLEVEYVLMESWPEMFEALKTGEVDLIPNQGITERRKQWFAFTDSVETFPVSIFVRPKEKGIKDLASLSEKRVAVVRLNVGETLVKDVRKAEIIRFDHVQDALFSLLSGNSDGLIFPEPVLMKIVRKAGIEDRIKTAGEPLTEVRRAMSVRKDNPKLLAQLNTALARLLKSDRYISIFEKWYGRPAPFWTPRRLVTAASILLVFTILLMGLWRYRTVLRLNRELRENIRKRQEAEAELKESHDTLEQRVRERTGELRQALSEIKTLSGLLPICSHCKKIRDDEGYWNQIESYITANSEAEFTHSICQDCLEKLYPEYSKDKKP